MVGYEELAPGLEFRPSPELARMVRDLDKVDRGIEAAAWRRARKENPKLARKLWRARKDAVKEAVEEFWNTPTCTKGGLANLLA